MEDYHVQADTPAADQPTPPPENQYFYSRPAPPKNRKKLAFIIAGAVVAVAALGGGGYAVLVHSSQPSQPVSANTKDTGTNNQQSSAQSAITPDSPADTGSGQYVSNGKDLNLSFAYPTSWSVTPPSNNNASDQPITITSPIASMVDANGKSVTGRVVVSIRPGGSDLAELNSGKATASQSSAQIAYAKPTSAQHQYPFVTFIHLPGGANPSGGFEEVLVTGISSFVKDKPILPTSFSALDPIVAARFYQCADQACNVSSSAALSVTSSTWQNNDTCAQALGIIQSLQIN